MDYLVLHLADRPALETIFYDATKCDDVITIREKYSLHNALERFLCRVHHSGRLNKIVNLPGKSIWNKKSQLLTMEFDSQNQYYVVFLEAAAIQYTPRELEMLNRHPNVHMCLLLFNPFDDIIALPEFKNLYENFKFEKIFAIFDETDISNRGFKRINAIYSKRNISPFQNAKSDCFFVGLAKDRQEQLEEIYDAIVKNGYKSDFTIVNPDLTKKNGINYITRFMDYNEYLQHVVGSKCIIEVLQGVQKGMTLRTFEAIVYGKHLITNNSYIKEYPFYNEKYMHYFEDINDLDFSSLNLNEQPDYGYNDEFSPRHLFEQIKEGL